LQGQTEDSPKPVEEDFSFNAVYGMSGGVGKASVK
jgi:hypothetical protein